MRSVIQPKPKSGHILRGFYRDAGRNPLRHIVQPHSKETGSVTAKALFKKN
ncbi:hypothetical protein CES85_1026 [Ochrobactrum quorumnocens]|uniref:Uncharacterized protein n=1 Tax=Ochrobactrum quorumnocens TaxID=271865 RepID=A0A248UFD3_9HYPH|nr:hypothetical protein CES85_1026 [[Ochrobactrum] quorumnocens]